MGIWNKLPEKYQQAIQEAATEACSWQRDLCRQLENQYWDKIRESGKSEINDDVDKAAFMDATKPVWAMFEEKLGKQNIEAIVNVQ
jgi:TRAP-type C4-dicarboxylate transport system substrate-binding protein